KIPEKKSGCPVALPPLIPNHANSYIRNKHYVNYTSVKSFCRLLAHLLNGFCANGALGICGLIIDKNSTANKK
ncbi:MAG: hypothetical protein M3015_11505, partial [Bacteroidota bacterium]|nr:hypothetical protein [Bacteroidota bacterium]